MIINNHYYSRFEQPSVSHKYVKPMSKESISQVTKDAIYGCLFGMAFCSLMLLLSYLVS